VSYLFLPHPPLFSPTSLRVVFPSIPSFMYHSPTMRPLLHPTRYIVLPFDWTWLVLSLICIAYVSFVHFFVLYISLFCSEWYFPFHWFSDVGSLGPQGDHHGCSHLSLVSLLSSSLLCGKVFSIFFILFPLCGCLLHSQSSGCHHIFLISLLGRSVPFIIFIFGVGVTTFSSLPF
jgi:hypothetical protein